YDISGLTGANIGTRDVSGGWSRLEIGLPMELGTGRLRPYAAISASTLDADAIDFSALGSATRFDTTDWDDVSAATAGVRYDMKVGPGLLQAGVEGGSDLLRVNLSFRLPLGG
ncbi:MAG: hypothetical protein ACKVKF_17290, partial [Rhodobacterales bacterium]